MAKQVSEDAAAPAAKKAGKVITGETRLDGDLYREAVNKIHSRLDAMETYCAGVKADVKKAYEDIANDFGISTKVAQLDVSEDRRKRKLNKKLQNLEPSQRDQLTALAKSFEGTPFGDFYSDMADRALAH